MQYKILLGTALLSNLAIAQQKPNIVIILADDMGYSDLSCYGSEISTPNLNNLASKGVTARHFYNASRSCPSRAALLTGMYPHQAGMGHMSPGLKLKPDNTIIESYEGKIPQNCPTIADLLHTAGYFTTISGKWHVSGSPIKQGFDQGNYIPGGLGQYFARPGDPMVIKSDTSDKIYSDSTLYLTDIFADNAIKSIDATPSGKPFFLYMAFTAPHTPMQAPDSLVEKYMPYYKNGWDPIIEKRFEKLKRLGIISKNEKTPGKPLNYASVDYNWDKLSAHEKWFMQRTMATYAAMIDRMDQNIGRIIAHLREIGKFENTVIFFMSDNGGTNEGHHEVYDNEISKIPGKPGHNGGPGPWWGRVSNTPYRLYKAYSSEGGISSPFIAYYPKLFPKGKLIKNNYFHIIDIMPTCLDLAGTSYPATFRNMPARTIYHKSMLPALLAKNGCKDTLSQRTLCWEHQGHIGVRKGKWKLTFTREFFWVNPSTLKQTNEMVKKWQLFDLEKDPFENNNIIEKYPEIVKQLKSEYQKWADNVGVVDWDRVNIWN